MGSQRPDSPVLPRTGSCLPSYRKMGMRDKGEGREARRVRGRGWAVARLRVIGRGIEKTDREKTVGLQSSEDYEELGLQQCPRTRESI